MKKLIIFSLLCLFSIQTLAEVQVQIEPSEVSVGESFNLALTQNNPQSGNGVPDLTPLRKDFEILGTARNMNYSIINGQTQASSTWVVTLKTQKTGTLTIPSITVGTEHTAPLVINVTANASNQTTTNNSGNQQDEDTFIKTSVNEEHPYVNQQIIYKVTLYNSKQLLDASYTEPKVENAIMIPLGDGKRYQTQRNNVPYLVEEQNYAIFPQKSGPVTITSPVFTAVVYDFQPQRITTNDKPISLDVQPIPKSFTGKEWLPAKQVKLSEEYENVGQTVDQGSTLIRKITIEGVGIPAQLLPSLHLKDADGYSVYPEKGKEHNQVSQGEVVSQTEIKVTYLFNKSGQVTIPELKLPWFNTDSGKEEIATLAAKSITVTPSANAPVNTNTQTPQPVNKEHATPALETSSPPFEFIPNNNWAWAIAALFALAWLITLGLWGWQKYQPNTGKSAYKKALNDLHKACMQGNPQQARDALLKWARLHWPDAPMLNLTDLSHLVHAAALKKQVHMLSQVLYKGVEKSLWRGDELWRSVQDIKPTRSKSKSENNVLPPINPI